MWGAPLSAAAQALDDVQQHFLGRHDDERAGGAPGDDEHFIQERIEQHLDVAAFQHEAAEDAEDDRDWRR